jgi:hypothetical protein
VRSQVWPFTGVLRERRRSVTRGVWLCSVKARAKLEKATFTAMSKPSEVESLKDEARFCLPVGLENLNVDRSTASYQ